MKIGIDCRLWSESGVGRYIRNLIINLQKIDKKNEYVLFVLPKDYFSVNSQLSTRNFQLVRADIRWHTVQEQLKFPRILNRENLDLVHFPYISVPLLYKKPFVVTIHDLILHHFPTGQASTLNLPLYNLKLLGYKFVISRAAKKSRRIITVSNATKKEIVDYLKVDSDKITVTYEGVENSKLKIQNSKSQFKVQSYFLYVGNAYPHKNLERMIKALALFCQNDIKLILVGKEDFFYKRLKEKVKNKGLEKSVEFLGEVSDEDLANLYRNAKALIMPSLMEGFGLPALEAMTNKCLVLASDIPSLREICEDAAVYFNPYDTEELFGKMKNIYSAGNKKYKANIDKGFERSKEFSWQKMAKETLEVYRQTY